MNMRTRRQAGFSVIELVITIAVIGIAAAVAVPAFTSVIANRRVSSSAQDLYATLVYARSEAIRRNQPVAVTPIGGEWSNGWEIRDPEDAANTLASHTQTNLSVDEVSGVPAVTYNASGRLQNMAQPVFGICDKNLSSNVVERQITLDLSGRPKLETNGNCS